MDKRRKKHEMNQGRVRKREIEQQSLKYTLPNDYSCSVIE
jgi:hypothetical protein